MTVIELHIKQVCLRNYIFPRSLGQTNWLEFYRCFVLSALPRTRPVCPPQPSSGASGPTNHALVITMSTIHVSNNTKVVWTDLQKTVYQLIWRQNGGNRKGVSGNDLGQSDNDRWRKNIFKRVHVQKKKLRPSQSKVDNLSPNSGVKSHSALRWTARNGVEISYIFTCLVELITIILQSRLNKPKFPQEEEQETQLDSFGNKRKH